MDRTLLKYLISFGLVAVFIMLPQVQSVQAFQTAEPPVVHAVMFWMATCGHCQYVKEEILPPLQAQYGSQFELLQLDLVTKEDIDRLYQTAAYFEIPAEQVGVPFLVIGDQVLSGSGEIADLLPGMIESHLAQGGLPYPELPALQAVLPAGEGAGSAATQETLASSTAASMPVLVIATAPATASYTRPVVEGFSLAALVLLGMIASLLLAALAFGRGRVPWEGILPARGLTAVFPLLCLLGLGVAGYLAYVETQSVQAICGPVGDCNTVQSSPYARLFGVLPVGMMGVGGYLALLAAWFLSRRMSSRLAGASAWAALGMAFFGVLFSTYLTILELFVIRAVCLWCLSSAVIITLLWLLSLQPALQARLDMAGQPLRKR